MGTNTSSLARTAMGISIVIAIVVVTLHVNNEWAASAAVAALVSIRPKEWF
jgi:hypothetical protein